MTEQQQGQQPDEVERDVERARPEPDQHNPETEEDTASGGPA
ncbi:hypothetical protein [Agrococcus sp. HG114]|nr:hypothetical protein [Agrococcus sp. HG114]MCR8671746.1 hypothetical protein [Agrococcus sp. HG114]